MPDDILRLQFTMDVFLLLHDALNESVKANLPVRWRNIQGKYLRTFIYGIKCKYSECGTISKIRRIRAKVKRKVILRRKETDLENWKLFVQFYF